MPSVKTYLGLGSNLGDRLKFLRDGVRGISRLGSIEGLSPVYQTEPIGGPAQGHYLNQVVCLHTDLLPNDLLRQCQRIEAEAGRTRGLRFGPRTLDVDILLYGEQIIQEEGLTVPQPRLYERRFVLDPLYALKPDLVLPRGEALARLRQRVKDQVVLPFRETGFEWEADFLPTLAARHPDVIGMNEVDSTNLEIRRRQSLGQAANGLTVVAEAQTQGRGRLGRVWASPPGTGLYLSRLVLPERALDPLLGFAVAVALSQTVAGLTGLKPGLKWPNDGILHGKKYAGILVEASTAAPPFAIIGIGTNVHGAMDPEFPTGITLDQASGRVVDRIVFFEQLMHRLDYWIRVWESQNVDHVLNAWRAYHVFQGAAVHILQSQRVVLEGTVDDVDETGRLLIRRSDGSVEAIGAGEVSVRLQTGAYAPSGPRY